MKMMVLVVVVVRRRRRRRCEGVTRCSVKKSLKAKHLILQVSLRRVCECVSVRVCVCVLMQQKADSVVRH